MSPLNLTIDLSSQRFVYPGDLGIGVRQVELTKGSTYAVALSFVSGSQGLTGFSPSGLCWNISQPNRQNAPLISLSGVSGSSFPLFVASPVLDYAICGEREAILGSYVAFSGGGASYNLAPLTSVLENNPSLSPQQQYYPLGDNPAAYLSSGSFSAASGQFASAATLNATGSALEAQILALDVESGTFYPSSNPSGFATATALGATGQALQAEIGALQSASGGYYPRTNPSGYITGMNTGGFYPSYNPSGFITSSALSPYALQTGLNATGQLLQSGVSALQAATGLYQTVSGLQTFTFALPTGQSTAYVPFPRPFTGVPVVSYSVNMPSTGYIYCVATSGVNQSGFRVLLSSSIVSSGYSLSVISRG